MHIRFKWLLIFAVVSLVSAQNIRVVNMVPNALSNETSRDAEPNLAFNPTDPTEIIGTAFTPNPSGSTATAPVYISQDGGNTWVLNNIIPSLNGSTGDITVGLSRNGVLYSGILTGGFTGPNAPQMQILRSNNYLAAGTMGNLLSRTNEDQPYVEVITPLGGARRDSDHVYVGVNDFNAASGQTASIEQSLNAATAAAPAGLTTVRLEARTTNGQDGPPIRTAAHHSGRVYGIFYRRTNSVGSVRTGDVIVVRDNNWGQGATPYTAITDPGDGLAGVRVRAGINWVWNNANVMGQERLGDRASIAVDPANNQTVYIAYIDRPAGVTGNTATIHVLASFDGGNTWSATDLLTVNNAIVPQLAVNNRSEVGILYQQLTGTAPNQNWVSHFQLSVDSGATWTDNILHTAPSNTPAAGGARPYLGDYAGLKARGKDFIGVFSGSNTPNLANFPQGVTFQRNANWTTNNLRNLANTANVAVSIDPYFFEFQQVDTEEDFYVRDWTKSPTDFDPGLEPSSEPIFHNRSDVWNRRSDTVSLFNSNDQPMSQNPWSSGLGSNYAYARVHREDSGVARTVNLHFLKSEFGTGSNYQHAGSAPDPTLTFSSSDFVKTMDSGYPWNLVATTSSHTCLAVEISTAQDPMIEPSLLGRAPGWPEPDLSVLYDNNKAQRNMGVYTESDGSSGNSATTYHAIIHNAATYIRDITIHFEVTETFQKLFKRPDLIFPTLDQEKVTIRDKGIILSKVRPGANIWVGLKIQAGVLSATAEIPAVHFSEIHNNLPINGFSIGVQSGPSEASIFENTKLAVENLFRMSRLLEWASAEEEANLMVEKLFKNEPSDLDYVNWHLEKLSIYVDFAKELVDLNGGNDPFQLLPVLQTYSQSVQAKDVKKTIAAHRTLNHKVDAFLTYLDKQQGDLADIYQTVRWQRDLFKGIKKFKSAVEVLKMFQRTEMFSKVFLSKKYSDEVYVKYVESSLPLFAWVSRQSGVPDIQENMDEMRSLLKNPKKLQRAHSKVLDRLEALRK